MKPILEPGRNCWRIERAERVAFLVDGAAYFRVLRDGLKQARESVLILAWDIDSRLRLRRDGKDDGWPEPLGDFLNALVSRERKLHGYILTWDFAMIYALDREWLPIYQLDWKTHRRLHFHMDDCHPLGASHHQKVVVIDDRLAFAGGLDLTMGRWDTPEHLPDDPRRAELSDEAARPHHDVQMAVSGEAARALGDLARERWRCATGRRLRASARDGLSDPWPEYLAADIEDVDVALARTLPEYEGDHEVRESERLYLDAIAAAEHWIYIENQYFTSATIAEALAARLKEARGPEVVIVLPLKTEGWLAQVTLDVIRLRLLNELVEADHAGRLRVFYPKLPDAADKPINVHAKLMIVDDDFVRVGSSNLNNRSMMMDSECDLALEARGERRVSEAIVRFRQRLLSEHLHVTQERVAREMAQRSSLVATIDALRGSGRSLEPLDLSLPESSVDAMSLPATADPEYPVDPAVVVRRMVPEEDRKPARKRILVWASLLLFILGLAAAWRWTPLSEWLTPAALAQVLAPLKNDGLAPFAVIGAFVLAGMLVVPLTLLIIAVVVSFGAWQGFIYSLIGALLSAMLTYGVGALIGRAGVRRLAGSRLNRISQQLARRGILTVFIVRIVPVAPFTVINLVAGASHLRFRDYVLGSLLGMTPGMLAIVLLVERIGAAIQAPSLETLSILVAVVLLVGLAVFYLMKWLRRTMARRAEEDESARSKADLAEKDRQALLD